MYWRDSLKIGVEAIDTQHKELFNRVNSFLEIVRGNSDYSEKISKIESMLEFVGDYVVTHFDSEEKLQKEIEYPNFETHHEIHEDFKFFVTDFKNHYKENGYSEKLVQVFAGKLTAWLINHVASEDQKISDYISKKETKGSKSKLDNKNEIILDSVKHIFSAMLELKPEQVNQKTTNINNSIIVEINIIGDLKGSVFYIFPKEIALSIVEKMAGMKMDELDDFVGSAVSELSNIISGNTLSDFDKIGYSCDITTPTLHFDKTIDEIIGNSYFETVHIKSEIGNFDFISILK